MVTGASGEGKSSVIYAGLVPNARAGFFKAKYSNWIVADFRPERTPLNSMSTALAEKLNSQSHSVETLGSWSNIRGLRPADVSPGPRDVRQTVQLSRR